MLITVAELKSNLEKYLQIVAIEDIYITQNDRIIAKLSSPYRGGVKITMPLPGQSKQTVADEEVMAVSARLRKKKRVAYEILAS